MGVGVIQMNFLHLLSSEAAQLITIHCLNVHVWADGESRPPSPKAVHFKTWNGRIIQARGFIQPELLKDECWVIRLSFILNYLDFLILEQNLIYYCAHCANVWMLIRTQRVSVASRYPRPVGPFQQENTGCKSESFQYPRLDLI